MTKEELRRELEQAIHKNETLRREVETLRRRCAERGRQLEKSQEQLNQLYPWEPELDHTGIAAFRCRTMMPERIFREEWEKQNERSPGTDNGFTTLELLLGERMWGTMMGDNRLFFRGPNQRDAEVAATIIQWLGTNCGIDFLKKCEGRIEKCREVEERKWANRHNGYPAHRSEY